MQHFILDSEMKEDNKIVLQRLGFEISRERRGLLLQSRKMAKRWQSFWKTHWNYTELVAFFLHPKKKQTSACYSDCLTIDWRNVAKVKWSSYCSSRLATSWPHEFLVSGVSFLGCKVAKWAMKSWEVPLHIKIGRRTCSGREASRKLKEAVCCRFCQGSVKLLENVSSKSGLGSTWLVRWKIRTACCKYLIII